MKNPWPEIKEKSLLFLQFCKTLIAKGRDTWKTLKFKKIKKAVERKLKKLSKMVSDSWKTLIIGVPTFLFCYYFIGAMISEKIDTSPIIKGNTEQSVQLQTPRVLQSLLRREIDEHIWTPNLPVIFPAYVLDNMPAFQIGIVHSVRDTAKTMKNFTVANMYETPIRKAVKLLNYRPDIWLLSQKSAFGIAPSSNSQYRKARKELEHLNEIKNFVLTADDLRLALKNISQNLRKITESSEAHVREFSGDWFDLSADDIFYTNKGYAFGLWQISEGLAQDFKQIILRANAYEEWTIFASNLQKAAEFQPRIVRNGEPESFTTPNHLAIQNYYLAAARAEAEKINNMLGEGLNAVAD